MSWYVYRWGMTESERLQIRQGDHVHVRHDDGSIHRHKVKYGPWQLGHGEWVLGIEGIAGCYLLERVVSHEPDLGPLSVGKMLSDMGVQFERMV